MRSIVHALSPRLPALSARARELRVRSLTGVSPERWRQLASIFPGLPEDPGWPAARRRRELRRRAARALASGRWNLRLDGSAPEPAPCVYVTGHIGSLQVLRYALRARGIPAATVLGPYNRERAVAAAHDRTFDLRHSLPFPHAFSSSDVHRLRSALKRGSLIAAADLPERAAWRFACSEVRSPWIHGRSGWRARPACPVELPSSRCGRVARR